MRRLPASEAATLRGAAFLAGANGTLWDSLSDAVSVLGEGEIFLPRLSETHRADRRSKWAARISAELQMAHQ